MMNIRAVSTVLRQGNVQAVRAFASQSSSYNKSSSSTSTTTQDAQDTWSKAKDTATDLASKAKDTASQKWSEFKDEAKGQSLSEKYETAKHKLGEAKDEIVDAVQHRGEQEGASHSSWNQQNQRRGGDSSIQWGNDSNSYGQNRSRSLDRDWQNRSSDQQYGRGSGGMSSYGGSDSSGQYGGNRSQSYDRGNSNQYGQSGGAGYGGTQSYGQNYNQSGAGWGRSDYQGQERGQYGLYGEGYGNYNQQRGGQMPDRYSLDHRPTRQPTYDYGYSNNQSYGRQNYDSQPSYNNRQNYGQSSQGYGSYGNQDSGRGYTPSRSAGYDQGQSFGGRSQYDNWSAPTGSNNNLSTSAQYGSGYRWDSSPYGNDRQSSWGMDEKKERERQQRRHGNYRDNQQGSYGQQGAQRDGYGVAGQQGFTQTEGPFGSGDMRRDHESHMRHNSAWNQNVKGVDQSRDEHDYAGGIGGAIREKMGDVVHKVEEVAGKAWDKVTGAQNDRKY